MKLLCHPFIFKVLSQRGWVGDPSLGIVNGTTLNM